MEPHLAQVTGENSLDSLAWQKHSFTSCAKSIFCRQRGRETGWKQRETKGEREKGKQGGSREREKERQREREKGRDGIKRRNGRKRKIDAKTYKYSNKV